MKIILLVGLPGSGKTYYGNNLGIKFIDDISVNRGTSRLEQLNEDFVVSDFDFCIAEVRELAINYLNKKFPNSTIETVFFENSPKKCWENVKRRNDGRCISEATIYHLSKNYIIPENIVALPVWSPEGDLNVD